MGVSSSEPSQQSSPCTDSLFLLALLPQLLLSPIPRWLMLTDLLMAVLTPALLLLTHMPLTELPLLPMLDLLLLPSLLPQLLMPVLDSQKPELMPFPQSDRSPRLPSLSRSSSPSSSGDTRLLTKQHFQD